LTQINIGLNQTLATLLTAVFLGINKSEAQAYEKKR